VPSSLAWLSIAEIQERVAARTIGPLDAARADLDRIHRLNPRLHAYVYVDDSPTSSGSGPLTGVPIAVKDTQPVAGMPWTAGSARWQERVASDDSIAVRRLRDAGVVLLGKTNTPELAASIGTDNDLFPATENPWRPGYTPGGSSGGSGVAVAAGLAAVAMGDDMGGSIRIPAAANGVVGLRPSPGRVPQDEPDPSHLNSPGPLARSVDDIRRVFGVLVREAPPANRRRSRRIAVITSSGFGVEDACVAACGRAAESLASSGHGVKAIQTAMPGVADEYVTIRPVTMGPVEGSPDEYGPAVRSLIQRGRDTNAMDFYLALQQGVAKARWLNDLLEEEFDAILTPTLGSLPMPIPQVPRFLSDAWKRYTTFVLPVSFSGLPAISVPAGLSDGLPVGIQVVGRYREEWDLLDLAEELEATPDFGYQRPPDMT
jgi:amidase